MIPVRGLDPPSDERSDERSETRSETREADPKHSGLGIAAFVISVAGVAPLFVALVVLIVWIAPTYAQGLSATVRAGFLWAFMLMVFLFVLSGGLGMAGLWQRSRRRLFAALAVAIDAAAFLAYFGLFLIYD